MMIKTTFLIVLIALAGGTNAISHVNPTTHALDVDKIIAEAEAKAEKSAREASLPEVLEAQQKADKMLVQNAMKQIAQAGSEDLADKLPLPSNIFVDEITAALSHTSAWQPSKTELANYESAHHNIWLLFDAGAQLSYYEWGCDTGNLVPLGQQVSHLMRQLVTTYPQRMLARYWSEERERFGYGNRLSKKCDQKALHNARQGYQSALAKVLEL